MLKHKNEIEYRKGEGLTGWIWQSGEKLKADDIRELHSEKWKGKYAALQAGYPPSRRRATAARRRNRRDSPIVGAPVLGVKGQETLFS